MNNTRTWNEEKVLQLFSEDDARLILASRIPQFFARDRIAWPITINGQYYVKYGYQF